MVPVQRAAGAQPLPVWSPRRRSLTRRNRLVAALMLTPAVVLCLGTIGYAIGLEAWFSDGPLGRSEIVSTFAFENALISGYIGLGAAIALVMVPVYVVMLVLAFRLLGRE